MKSRNPVLHLVLSKIKSAFNWAKSEQRRSIFKNRYIVDRKTQYALLICIVLVALAFSGFSIVCAIVWQKMMGDATRLADVPLTRLVATGFFIWLGGLVVTMISIFGANYFSNSLIAPVWKLENHMRSVLNGENPPPLRIRSSDHFQEVIETYNRLLSSQIKSAANKKSE